MSDPGGSLSPDQKGGQLSWQRRPVHTASSQGAPFAVRPSVTTELQPDVLVARKQDLTENHSPTAPLLAVEVLSSSTMLYDVGSKKPAYERLGVSIYWVIDPLVPRATAFGLDKSGQY